MKNLKRQFTFIGSFIALTFLVWGAPVSAIAPPPDLIDVVEIIGTNPFIVHTNILPGDAFSDNMTVNNLTGTPQDIVMGLDIDLSQGIVPLPPYELEERITVRIEKVGIGYLILPGPGGDTVATLQELDDTVIDLGTIAGSSSQLYKISAVFDPSAGNEYQNTKVYFNISMSVDVPDIQGSLRIFKTNNSVGTQLPGDIVTYTLMVTALHGAVANVTLTDLPPAGFVYVHGSGIGAPFIHGYASPGVWDLGDLAEGESKTVTYQTTISSTQDDGLYKDIAFAKGTNGNGDAVLAVDPGDSDNFVGTQVAVATDATPTVVVPEDHENKLKEKVVKKIKYVLGAATTLPMTGANTVFLVLAIVLLLGGIGLIVLSKRRRQLSHSVTKTMMKSFFFAVLASASLVSAQTASAASLAVQIETPEAVVQSPDFQIGFVALDILGRAVTVECFKESDVLPFASYPLIAGGSSGNCQINAAVMPADGDYVFYVKAIASGEGSETVESNHVNVKLVSTVPGTPYNYDRHDADCQNVITFTTAADAGRTVKVELYRSLSTSFTADASTKAAEQAIGSNVAGSFSIAAPGCSNDYFYALRAVDASGFGSGFVGDKDVNVDTHTVTKTKTTIVETPGTASTGAIAVTGTGGAVSEGAVEGAETTNEETVPGETETVGGSGSVLGEMTETVGDAAGGFVDWIQSHPWWSALIALIALALGYYGYETYQRKHNEPLQ